jgi:hypothetical protein
VPAFERWKVFVKQNLKLIVVLPAHRFKARILNGHHLLILALPNYLMFTGDDGTKLSRQIVKGKVVIHRRSDVTSQMFNMIAGSNEAASQSC